MVDFEKIDSDMIDLVAFDPSKFFLAKFDLDKVESKKVVLGNFNFEKVDLYMVFELSLH